MRGPFAHCAPLLPQAPSIRLAALRRWRPGGSSRPRPGRAPGSPWRSPRTAGFAAGPVSMSAPCLTRGRHSTAWSPDTPTLGRRTLRSRDRLTCAGHPTGLAQLGCLPWALSSVTGILGACCSRRPHPAPPAKQGPAFPTTEPPCDASSCPAAIPGTCSSGGSPPHAPAPPEVGRG